jgi:glutathione S-transferase
MLALRDGQRRIHATPAPRDAASSRRGLRRPLTGDQQERDEHAAQANNRRSMRYHCLICLRFPPTRGSPLMKLYYAPGSCSMASHIVLEELGKPYESVRVDIRDPARKTSSGENYLSVNPQGYVPSLKLASGEVLTETSALLAWLGEQDPTHRLMPPAGTLTNFRVREWLGFLSVELHKNCSPLFRPGTPEETIRLSREMLAKRLAYVNEALGSKPYLTGEQFTPADAYLFVILSWFGRLNIDMAPYPNLQALQARAGARASVQKVLKDEGLVKAA